MGRNNLTTNNKKGKEKLRFEFTSEKSNCRKFIVSRSKAGIDDLKFFSEFIDFKYEMFKYSFFN